MLGLDGMENQMSWPNYLYYKNLLFFRNGYNFFPNRLYICSDVKSHTVKRGTHSNHITTTIQWFCMMMFGCWDSNSPIHHDQGICPRLLCPVSMTSIHTFVCKMKFSSLDDPQLDFNSIDNIYMGPNHVQVNCVSKSKL